MTARRKLLQAAASMAALAVAGVSCSDVHQAPTEPPPAAAPYVTVTLDTLHGFMLDVGGQWGGVTLLRGADGSAHVLAFDNWNARLRYYGCANACDDRTHWFSATGDSSAYNEFSQTSPGVVLTADGFHVVYTQYIYGHYGPTIRYEECPGACNFGSNWSGANLFVDLGALDQSWWLGHGTPLAADSSGGLHLLFSGSDQRLYYARCGGACADSTSWQKVPIDTGANPLWPRLIAVASDGSVHAVYGKGTSLVHAVCSANCTGAAAWSSGAVPGATLADGLQAVALAFGRDGSLDLAYLDQSSSQVPQVMFAACPVPCGAPGTWSLVGLPLQGFDVSLGVDSTGALYLGSIDTAVAVLRCAASCSDTASWKLEMRAAANTRYGGRVSLGVDRSGAVSVASSYAWPQTLQLMRLLR